MAQVVQEEIQEAQVILEDQEAFLEDFQVDRVDQADQVDLVDRVDQADPVVEHQMVRRSIFPGSEFKHQKDSLAHVTSLPLSGFYPWPGGFVVEAYRSRDGCQLWLHICQEQQDLG